jgi:hypothetical protein
LNSLSNPLSSFRSRVNSSSTRFSYLPKTIVIESLLYCPHLSFLSQSAVASTWAFITITSPTYKVACATSKYHRQNLKSDQETGTSNSPDQQDVAGSFQMWRQNNSN